MIVQCSAERLREARDYEPFARHEAGLRRVITEISPKTSGSKELGQLAVQGGVSEPEELPGSLIPIDESSSMGLINGPDNSTVTAVYYLGPPGNLL